MQGWVSKEFGVAGIVRIGRCMSFFDTFLLAGQLKGIEQQCDAEDAKGGGQWTVGSERWPLLRVAEGLVPCHHRAQSLPNHSTLCQELRMRRRRQVSTGGGRVQPM